jgi:hypothetical protein
MQRPDARPKFQRFDAKQYLLHRLHVREERLAIPIKLILLCLDKGGGDERAHDSR